VIENVEAAPDWQNGLKSMTVLERDGDGRAVLCESESDAKVRTVKSTVRFEYAGPAKLSWSQQKGELASVDGSWQLQDLGDGKTRATYALEVDPGRMLGMIIRGPLVDLLREMLVGARAGELKRYAESERSSLR
jgi:hypothetical protein